MDNLAHTLVGAALGQAGLKRKTGLGMAALMLAANLPDIDAFGLLFGENLAWRRGWSHGPIALVILPVLLALALVAFDRWQIKRGTRPRERPPVRFKWLLILSYIGILSHPLLDWLNTYGIRCLMPFSEKWFYGDTLFIIDIWMWLTLGGGVWLSRRFEKHGGRDARAWIPAVSALVLMVGYNGLMFAGGRAAEAIVAKEVAEAGLGEPVRVLASPVPINPLRRRMVFDLGDHYGFGDFSWGASPRFDREAELVPTNMDDPAIPLAAKHSKEVADFLYWSRFPFAEIETTAGIQRVVIGDARYNSRASEGRFIVEAEVPINGDARGKVQ